MVHEHDPEPRHYYDWMLWKLRQENMEQDDPTDDITKTGGRLSAWTERPHMSREDIFMKEIAMMQESNHTLMIRIKEQAEEIEKLKKRIDADL